MLAAVRLLQERGAPKPVCIAVHGLFADHSDTLLAQAGARVVTSNSIPHESNDVDVGEILANAISKDARLVP
jgi:ribose-phosphate pyrophosphokinase